MSRIALYTLFPVLTLATALPACGRDMPRSNTPDELADAFTTAGFRQSANDRWVRCQEDPPTLSYAPGRAEITDLNSDGLSEVWITEGSIFCYGNTASAFVLLTRDGDGWRTLLDTTGVQRVLDTQHMGWPDIEAGGPGFGTFPVYRWNGHDYQQLK